MVQWENQFKGPFEEGPEQQGVLKFLFGG